VGGQRNAPAVLHPGKRPGGVDGPQALTEERTSLSTWTVSHGQLVAQNEEIEQFRVTSCAEAGEGSAGAKTHTTSFSWCVKFISKPYFLHYELPLFWSCTRCSAVTEFTRNCVIPAILLRSLQRPSTALKRRRCTF